ncbi:MAG: segregation/condensation protein A [Phycisphaeraceae bacterium]|nr:segregation/condensation protein A [Phycisphaeraceae bacterium]
MTDYRVELDNYSGPMDLLLYLVRKHEIDLYDIPIAKLTDQYLAHLDKLQQVDIELAGEFLVMAATLLEIKSQMLLPPSLAPEGADSSSAAIDSQGAIDPRLELVQQLLAYKRYKDAAIGLETRLVQWEQRFARRPPSGEVSGQTSDAKIQPPAQPGGTGESLNELVTSDDAAASVELDLEDANVMDLCEAFARILDSIGQISASHAVLYDDTPIALHAADIVDRLQRDGRQGQLNLPEIMVGRTRSEAVGLFLALLELIRQRRVAVEQPGDGQVILQLRNAGAPAEETPEASLYSPPHAAGALGATQHGEACCVPHTPPPPDAASPETSAAQSQSSQVSKRWVDPHTGEVQYDWPDDSLRLRAEKRAHLRALWQAKKAAGAASPLDEDAFMNQLDEEEGDDADSDAE